MIDENEPIDFPRSNTGTDENPIQIDWEQGKQPSVVVVEAIVEVTGRDPTDIPPIHHYAEADALDDLVTAGTDNPRSRISVTFDYDGIVVTLDSDGVVEIQLENVINE